MADNLNYLTETEIDGRTVVYRVVAGRIAAPKMKYTRKGLVVTVPETFTAAAAKAFVQDNAAWLRAHVINDRDARDTALNTQPRTDAEFRSVINTLIGRNYRALILSGLELPAPPTVRFRLMRKQLVTWEPETRTLTVTRAIVNSPREILRLAAAWAAVLAADAEASRNGTDTRAMLTFLLPDWRDVKNKLPGELALTLK